MTDDWDWVSPSGLVRIRGSSTLIGSETKAEYRTCEKEMRLIRQQLVLDRRDLDAEIRDLRARWRQYGTISPGTPISSEEMGRELGRAIAGGLLGSRSTSSKDHERKRFDEALAALQCRREFVISKIAEADRIILAVRARTLGIEQEMKVLVPPKTVTCLSCVATEVHGARFCGQCGAKLR